MLDKLYFEDLVKIQFAKPPGTHKWTCFHIDSGKELLSKRVGEFLGLLIKMTDS